MPCTLEDLYLCVEEYEVASVLWFLGASVPTDSLQNFYEMVHTVAPHSLFFNPYRFLRITLNCISRIELTKNHK